MAIAPKIKLYTNYNCPWAHRAHIALAELNVPYEEEIIDLYTPRTPEYLAINPRGLVPAINFNGTIIAESAIVSTFLADTFPSTLLPKSTDSDGPLMRARINFFVDAYFSKAQGNWAKLLAAQSPEDSQNAFKAYVDAVANEVDPLLTDAAPFFGGSDKLTLAEVLAGSWLLRVYTLPKHGLVPSELLEELANRAPNFDKWAKEVIQHPSVRCIWNEDKIVTGTRAWIAKSKA